MINCQKWSFLAPEIIVLEKYKGFHRPKNNFSRRNIFIRDNNTCQYCGYHVNDRKKFNLDHVIAKSKGGRATWSNIVYLVFHVIQRRAVRLLKKRT
jgi:5-methylcytosine-specific restriction endonuclease McrA